MSALDPKKSLGQHFLNDTHYIHKILEALPAQPEDLVIEIGPGTGALTEYLLADYPHLKAIELDDRAVELLRDKYPSLEVIQGDVLKIDWATLVQEYRQAHPEGKIHVIGNLPYYITSQILFGLLEVREHLDTALLMMQKEVAERIVAEPRSKAYGILSIQTQLWATAELLFEVPAGAFSPPPKVTSAILKLTFDKAALPVSDKQIKQVVRTAFNQRRKKLRNSLKPIIGDFEPSSIDVHKRAEALLPEAYVRLTEELEQNDMLA
jgi:16S rRNA (adenine1518-N6/adenine1519-N6)-dimethyltransferase